MTDNLWGSLPEPDDTPLPTKILKEQAIILTKSTSGLLEGRVYDNHIQTQTTKRMNFDILCPLLNSYSVDILYVVMERFTIYPCKIKNILSSEYYDAEDLESFKEKISIIFQSEGVRKIISALLRDAKAK